MQQQLLLVTMAEQTSKNQEYTSEEIQYITLYYNVY